MTAPRPPMRRGDDRGSAPGGTLEGGGRGRAPGGRRVPETAAPGEADQARPARPAKITPNRARKAALAAVPGAALALRLRRAADTVIYDVTVRPDGGGPLTAVLVDAAGTVLAIGPAGREDDDGGG